MHGKVEIFEGAFVDGKALECGSFRMRYEARERDSCRKTWRLERIELNIEG